MLEEGQKAPLFELPIAGGGEISLEELRGKPVAVYFYPRDNTSGCTREAVDFTGLAEEFAKIGVKIIGISPDSVKKHENFIAKHGLNLVLASDEEKKTAIDYGVWAEKKMYGRAYMGIVRSTFLIDDKGRLARIWPKVRVKGHAQEVLEAARELVQTGE
jgi:peroxiredoxin Q/BCP